MKSHKKPNLLVLAPNWLGDCIMSLPALQYLQASGVALHVLVRQEFKRLFEDVNAIEIHTFATPQRWQRLRQAWQLRARQPEACVVMMPSFTGGLMAWASGARLRIGEQGDLRSGLLSHAMPAASRQTHLSLAYQGLARVALRGLQIKDPEHDSTALQPVGLYGVPVIRPRTKEIFDAAQDLSDCGVQSQSSPLVLACGARFGPSKQYPVALFAEAARALQEQLSQPIVLVGGGGDLESAAELQALLPGSHSVVGKTSMSILIGVLASSSAILSNDSGIMHLAAALGKPTVGIFGSTNPLWTRPLGPYAAHTSHPVWCSPCYRPTCSENFECMLQQNPQMVAQTLVNEFQRFSKDAEEGSPRL